MFVFANLVYKAIDFLREHKTHILVLLAGLLIGSYVTYRLQDTPKATTSRSSVPNAPVSTTNIQVTTKTKETDPDLSLTQKYVATINDKKVEVPIKNVVSEAATSAGSVGGASPYTATVSQTIDLTPLIKPTIPSWEVGIGVGHYHGETYGSFSLQRNYKKDKAISVELNIDPSDRQVKGLSIQHKWLFH